MNVAILLDVVLGASGALALVGLGGVATVLARTTKSQEITITVDIAGKSTQAFKVSRNSPLVRQLGLHLKDLAWLSETAVDERSVQSRIKAKRRSFELLGLIGGVAATGIGSLPFISNHKIIVLPLAVGALILTRFGEILTPLKKLFASLVWRDATVEDRLKIIIAIFFGESGEHPHVRHRNGA